MGGVSTARRVGIIIPSDGFYEFDYTVVLSQSSTETRIFLRVDQLPSSWVAPTAVNYCVAADVAAAVRYFWVPYSAMSTVWSAGQVSNKIVCTAGQVIVPTINVVDLAKNIEPNSTSFSLRRIA